MTTNIIQHHKPFDFQSFFEGIKSGYVGLDFGDFRNFLHAAEEIHSFMGRAEWKDRVKNAFESAIASDDAVEIINRASSVMITIIRNPDAERPVSTDEVRCISEYISGFPNDCNVVWGLADDPSLGNAVEIILLASVKIESAFNIEFRDKAGNVITSRQVDKEVCELWGIESSDKEWASPPGKGPDNSWNEFLCLAVFTYRAIRQTGIFNPSDLLQGLVLYSKVLKPRLECIEEYKYEIQLLLYWIEKEYTIEVTNRW